MRKKLVFGILMVMLAWCAAPSASAEKIVVGYQPYTWYPWPAIIEELGLAKKYLPPGTEVDFQGALHGAVHSNNMLAGKCDIAYMAVMPATIACSKPDQADIRIVSSITVSNGMHCSLIMARADAPDFKTPEEAIKWMDGKIVATPKGSCADQFLRMAFEEYKVKPAEYLNQSIEIITTNFRAKKIDASAVWEPTASRIGTLAGEGLAKIVATGNCMKNPDIALIIMRGDFVDKHPDLVEGYLKMNLEAVKFLMDPKNQKKAVEMIAKHAVGMPESAIWYSIYGQIPPEVGGTSPKWIYPFIVDDVTRKNINDSWAFGYKEKLIAIEKPSDKVIDDKIAQKILKDANLTSPVAEVKGQPNTENPFK